MADLWPAGTHAVLQDTFTVSYKVGLMIKLFFSFRNLPIKSPNTWLSGTHAVLHNPFIVGYTGRINDLTSCWQHLPIKSSPGTHALLQDTFTVCYTGRIND